MSIASRKLLSKYEFNMSYCDFILIVTIGIRYVADVYCPKEPPYQM